jgi:anaerobic magnesium-protoporphyrin IX monomethyl ester cyclase
MKILLINPPRHNEILADNPAFIDEERGYNPPLGLLYLAGYLKENSHHQVFGLDAQVERLDYNDEFKRKILEINPEVVGITAMTFTLIDVLETINLVRQAEKELGKKIIIVLGGPHVHLFPKETINLPGVDYLVKGEGEAPFFNLLEALENKGDLSQIQGLVFKKDGQVFDNPTSGLIENLDSLPFPDRELLPIEKYSSVLSGSHIVTTMFTSRGCPFQCAFCDRPHLGKKFRARSAKNVVDEIEECLKLGIDEILIYDDTFTVDKQRTIKICDEIINRGLKFVWDIRARVDTVDQESLAKLKQAGCARIHFGVEAGTDKILKVLNKGIILKQAENAFTWAKKEGIETLGYFMIGSPTETREDIEQTIRFAKRINPDYVSITILTPYPATKIYQMALEQGVIESDYWREFAANPGKGITVKYWERELTKKELFELLNEFYKEFYGRPVYFLKELLKIKSFKDLIKKARAGLKILSN